MAYLPIIEVHRLLAVVDQAHLQVAILQGLRLQSQPLPTFPGLLTQRLGLTQQPTSKGWLLGKEGRLIKPYT